MTFHDLVGKTIRAAVPVSYSGYLVLHFTDGGHAILGVQRGHEPGDDELILVEDSDLRDYELRDGGLITSEECKRREAEINRASKQQAEQRERELLASLKAKYEPK